MPPWSSAPLLTRLHRVVHGHLVVHLYGVLENGEPVLVTDIGCDRTCSCVPPTRPPCVVQRPRRRRS
ncbi:MAG: hypothetical protein U0807_07855 [Candidatus Binatia bacterium]